MTDRVIEVQVDDRARLMSAVLSATDWPEKAHQRKGHRAHLHARNTQKHVAGLKDHPAVKSAQSLLDKNAPLEALYTYIMRLSFPELTAEVNPPWVPANWNVHLRDFYEKAGLKDFWASDAPAWEKAVNEATTIIKQVDFYTFLKPFVGNINDQLVYMPNISYPSDMAVGMRVGSELLCIGPPRIAWGDNPPWPFDEDQGHIYSTSLAEYARLLMLGYLRHHSDVIAPITKKKLPVDEAFEQKYPSWGDQFTELIVPGIVTLFLAEKVNEQEAKAFILMERKTKGVTILPGVVSVLRRYLGEYQNGKYSDFTEYMPLFPGHLKIAKGITSL